jgi:hypothetical protein
MARIGRRISVRPTPFWCAPGRLQRTADVSSPQELSRHRIGLPSPSRAAAIGLRPHSQRLLSNPVSDASRTSLCLRGEFLPGKALARSETGPAFLTINGEFRVTETGLSGVSRSKPREVKDISTRAKKPDLRRTAWWGWQDSKSRGGGQSCREASGRTNGQGMTGRLSAWVLIPVTVMAQFRTLRRC